MKLVLITVFLMIGLLLYGTVYAVGQSKDREQEDREQTEYLMNITK